MNAGINLCVILFFTLPAAMMLNTLSRGLIMPVITTTPQVWNIQYLPFVVLSAVCAGLAFHLSRTSPFPKLYLIAGGYNLVWLAITTVPVVYLWGRAV